MTLQSGFCSWPHGIANRPRSIRPVVGGGANNLVTLSTYNIIDSENKDAVKQCVLNGDEDDRPITEMTLTEDIDVQKSKIVFAKTPKKISARDWIGNRYVCVEIGKPTMTGGEHSYQVRFEVGGISQDYNPEGLCWNNQPESHLTGYGRYYNYERAPSPDFGGTDAQNVTRFILTGGANKSIGSFAGSRTGVATYKITGMSNAESLVGLTFSATDRPSVGKPYQKREIISGSGDTVTLDSEFVDMSTNITCYVIYDLFGFYVKIVDHGIDTRTNSAEITGVSYFDQSLTGTGGDL